MKLNLTRDEKSPKINVSQVTLNLKKGNWKKKRMDAKRIVQRLKKNSKSTSNLVDSNNSNAVELKNGNAIDKSRSREKRDIPRDFSSSIFTSNPVPIKRKLTIINNTVQDDLFTLDSTFESLGINKVLSLHLEKMNLTRPTNVQRISIPTITDTFDRDIIIQAQTGSGKTLAFLLPIINSLVNAGINGNTENNGFFSRKTGCFCIVLVPTRELATQISGVLEKLLQYSKFGDESKHWLVSGIIIGGESRKSEKARLRKGINILVCTPGRLLDHLNTTESFCLDNLRWLVLDEADSLMHLGFEETLKSVLKILSEKGKCSVISKTRVHVEGLPIDRQTILCSATIEGGIEKLVEESLVHPLYVLGDKKNDKVEKCADKPVVGKIEKKSIDAKSEIQSDKKVDGNDTLKKEQKTIDMDADSRADLNVPKEIQQGSESESENSVHVATIEGDAAQSQTVENIGNPTVNVAVPVHLKQYYVNSPAKLRLVNLIGLMRKVPINNKITDCGKKGAKVILFLSTADSADWHFDLFLNAMLDGKLEPSKQVDKLDPEYMNLLKQGSTSALFPESSLFKLHGSMSQSERQSVIAGFSQPFENKSAFLLCTDVVGRGLDVPDVTQVIQYDPPAEIRDYIHRIGRTARLGKQGSSYIFLLPSESEYLDMLEAKQCILQEVESNSILQTLEPLSKTTSSKPRKSKHKAYEIAATDLHMALERMVHESAEVIFIKIACRKSQKGIPVAFKILHLTCCCREIHFSYKETASRTYGEIILVERSTTSTTA